MAKTAFITGITGQDGLPGEIPVRTKANRIRRLSAYSSPISGGGEMGVFEDVRLLEVDIQDTVTSFALSRNMDKLLELFNLPIIMKL